MTDNNPITPPPELVEQWTAQGVNREAGTSFMTWFATQAAQWGANIELEACVNYIDNNMSGNKAREFRAIRRPKPPSLKEQALELLPEIKSEDVLHLCPLQVAKIRRALEQLDD